MFTKILIANRGDKLRAARLAAQGHGGRAAVSRSHIAWQAQPAAIEPRS